MKLEAPEPSVTIDGHAYPVQALVAAEIVRLQQLAQAWEEDARKYAARVDQLLKEQKWREPRNHWAMREETT